MCPKTKLFRTLIASFSIISLVVLHSCNSEKTCGPNSVLVGDNCVCEAGYSGELCIERDLSIIENVECENDGSCESGECQCIYFWTGESCTEFIPDVLVGKYIVIESEGLPDSLMQSFELYNLLGATEGDGSHAHGGFKYDGESTPGFLGCSFNDQSDGDLSSLDFILSSQIDYYPAILSFRFQCTLEGDRIEGAGVVYDLQRGGGGQTKVNPQEVSFVAIRI